MTLVIALFLVCCGGAGNSFSFRRHVEMWVKWQLAKVLAERRTRALGAARPPAVDGDSFGRAVLEFLKARSYTMQHS